MSSSLSLLLSNRSKIRWCCWKVHSRCLWCRRIITTQAIAPTNAIHAITAKATSPGEVPPEWEEEAAAEVLAAAAVCDVLEAAEVDVILEVLEEMEDEEIELEELVVLGAAILGKELEATVESDVVASLGVFVDFADFELELDSVAVGAAVVAAAVLSSSEPSGKVTESGPRAMVIPLSWTCIGTRCDISNAGLRRRRVCWPSRCSGQSQNWAFVVRLAGVLMCFGHIAGVRRIVMN